MIEKSSLEEKFPQVPQPAGMSREQYNYAVALALYEHRHEVAKEEAEGMALPQVQEVYQKHRVDEVRELLKVAEDGLIDWAEGSMREKYGVRFEQVAVAFTAKGKPGFRQRLVDLCFGWKESAR